MSNTLDKMDGPALPVGSSDMRDPMGRTLWDYYAAAALACTDPDYVRAGSATGIASEAARVADQMLAERAKRMEES
jgi:hypothetical protein